MAERPEDRYATPGALVRAAGATVPAGDGPTSVAVSPDGRRAYVTVLNDAVVRVHDLAA